MAIPLDTETLEQAAKDGSMDYEKWPAILEPLLARLEQILHDEFPIPKVPPPDWLRREGTDTRSSDGPGTLSTTPDTPSQTRNLPRTLPPVPPFDASTSTSTSNVRETTPTPTSQNSTTPASSIPELLIQQLSSINQTLRSEFADRPPHTIQRLAELVLAPTKHYKSLPAWLRAVDRAISVTSTADIFPLPLVQYNPQDRMTNGVRNDPENGLANGLHNNGLSSSESGDSSLGSDESLGGALLTPIPWLRGGEIAGTTVPLLGSPRLDDPLNLRSATELQTGSVPERQDGAVTQGELIRMEQEAGIVPISRSPGLEGPLDDEDQLDVMPYARGPDVVGVEDVGPQGGNDVDVQLGSSKRERGDQGVILTILASERAETTSQDAADGRAMSHAEPNGDGDIVLADADGKIEKETEATSGLDSVDQV